MTKKKDETKSVVNGASTGTGVAERSQAARDHFAAQEAAKKAKSVVLSPEDCKYKIFDDYGPEYADKYVALIQEIMPAKIGNSIGSGTREWAPPFMGIRSTRSQKPEVIANVEVGALYYMDTNLQVADDELFFPLFAHDASTWWDDNGKAICKTIDCVKGFRMSGALKGSAVECGSETCPNTPDRYLGGQPDCKYGHVVYFINKSMTNIRRMESKYYGITTMGDALIDATKSGSDIFSPEGKTWFSLSSYVRGEGQKKAYYGKAVPTTTKLDDAEVFITHQAQGIARAYYESQIVRRDTAGERAEKAASSVPTTSIKGRDGKTVSTLGDMPSM